MVTLSKTPISAHGDSLSNIIENLPFSGHLRDSETGRFLMANQYQANNNNLKKIEDVLQSTSADLFYNRKTMIANLGASLAQEDEYRSLFEKAFYHVKNVKTPTHFREETILRNSGFIYVGINSKVPILGENQKTIAVLTYAQETTSQIELFYLYCLYKQYYCSELLAIQYFLRYLKIEDCFIESPTNAEVLTLLALRQAATYKLASQFLHKNQGIFIKPGTIGVHLQNLRAKFKLGKSLDILLMILRESR